MELKGRKILLVEDEALIAMDVEAELLDAGAEVVGPIPALEEAKAFAIASECDAAVLDIMLGRKEVFPAADVLVERGIPFLFHSAHAEVERLKVAYPDAPLCSKPGHPRDIVVILSQLLRAEIGEDDRR